MLLVCAAVHAALFLWLYKTPAFYYKTGSDTQHVYWPAVQKVLAGHIPYRDPYFFVEYPPLGAAIFLLPALFHPTTLRAFDWLFSAEMLLVDLAALPILLALARRSGVSPVRALVAYAVLVLSLGPVVCQRYDLVPAVLCQAAILALVCERPTLAWALLLAATLTKLYPAALAPLFAVYERRHGRHGVVGYLGSLLLFVAAWYALAPASLARFLYWETQRGIEIETLTGSVVQLLHLAGLPVRIVPPSAYGSYDVSSALTPMLELLANVAAVVLLTGVYLSYALSYMRVSLRRFLPAGDRGGWISTTASIAHRDSASPRGPLLVAHATLAVLALLLSSKLFSIQFLLWLYPLVALRVAGRVALLGPMVCASLLSWWIYPAHWNNLWGLQTPAILAMAARNLLLVVVLILLWRGRRTGAWCAR